MSIHRARKAFGITLELQRLPCHLQQAVRLTGISMLNLRQDAEQVLNRSQAGERLVLTHRGKPVTRLEPVSENAVAAAIAK